MWSDDEKEFTDDIKSSKSAHKMVQKLDRFVRDTASRFRATFHSTLLPAGFPDSVHHCYVPFSFWQFIETTAGAIIQVLCSQAMLSSVGLPTDVGSVTGGAVAIRWVIKDGLSHFAQLLFTK
uniref:Protein root UVB sensitive/RUS domain-containing protein n=1 Tax=Lygus hesperus TaxID=30085 RepID=A0A0A9Y1S4_LYGHE